MDGTTSIGPGEPRQLVLCFDGTNNTVTGGRFDTNVVKLCKALAPGVGQLVYYDPGVGNPGAVPGATRGDKLRGIRDRIYGLAFGKGVYENIGEAYAFLMREWRPKDRIFVFGFSRGAFTARSVAGMVSRFGILPQAMSGMLPTMLHLYFANAKEPGYQDVVDQIKRSFCTAESAEAEVWFTGVWDTVESVGAPFSRSVMRSAPTTLGKRLIHVRHALALDEHRNSFYPRPYYVHPDASRYAAEGKSVEQLWFSGSHCDVGGGYEERDARLSEESLLWMLEEAMGKGLLVKPGLWCAADGSGPVADRRFDRAAALECLRMPLKAEQARRSPLVHSETFNEAYWALAGLGVRKFDEVKGEAGDPPSAPPKEHPSVAAAALRFPQDTVWATGERLNGRFWLALVGALVGLLGHGAILVASDGQTHGLAEWLAADWKFTRQQGPWLFDLPLPWIGRDGWEMARLLAADLLLIACYGYLLARGLSRGFATAAGLSRVDRKPPAALNAMGKAGLVTVSADVAEDAAMALASICAHFDLFSWAAAPFTFVMALAWTIKWVALAAALLLCLRGLGSFFGGKRAAVAA